MKKLIIFIVGLFFLVSCNKQTINQDTKKITEEPTDTQSVVTEGKTIIKKTTGDIEQTLLVATGSNNNGTIISGNKNESINVSSVKDIKDYKIFFEKIGWDNEIVINYIYNNTSNLGNLIDYENKVKDFYGYTIKDKNNKTKTLKINENNDILDFGMSAGGIYFKKEGSYLIQKHYGNGITKKGSGCIYNIENNTKLICVKDNELISYDGSNWYYSGSILTGDLINLLDNIKKDLIENQGEPIDEYKDILDNNLQEYYNNLQLTGEIIGYDNLNYGDFVIYLKVLYKYTDDALDIDELLKILYQWF